MAKLHQLVMIRKSDRDSNNDDFFHSFCMQRYQNILESFMNYQEIATKLQITQLANKVYLAKSYCLWLGNCYVKYYQHTYQQQCRNKPKSTAKTIIVVQELVVAPAPRKGNSRGMLISKDKNSKCAILQGSGKIDYTKPTFLVFFFSILGANVTIFNTHFIIIIATTLNNLES